ncbi:MAG: DegT/DnrJ/EryC1/StrS aminotransferase family protein [Pseudomonadota bacterium]
MSEQQFLPFVKPTISEEAIAEVVDTIRSGWLTTGPKVNKFEEMLSKYHGDRRVLCVSSATAGLHLVLLSLGFKEGDEVITTPMTFVATLNTIIQAGGKPVLVDIAPNTLNINPDAIEAAITSRTRAIIPVHFAGLPCDMDVIYDLAKKHNLRVIEDCAHSIGATYKDKRLGSFGDIQVISFHPNKNITTGEGGAIITNDSALLYTLERLRFHGIDRNAFNRFSKAGSPQYDVVMPGFKYNMMDIQAALGIHQLPELANFIEKRTSLANRYLEVLGDWEEFTLPQAPQYAHSHAWHLFTVQLKQNAAGLDRDGLINAMKAENIGVGLHYQSIHTFTYYSREYGWKPDDFPNSLAAGDSIFSLPLFPTMTIDEQDRVIKSLEKVLKK